MTKVIDKGELTALFGGAFELINHGANTGRFNMDFDFERTKLVADGLALPMFRLYAWNPWAVSLGANQKESEINLDECKNRNFDLVRRPTGGRAVLHANELTYSVVMKLPENMTVHDAYREIHMILRDGLVSLGCETLDFEKSQPDFRSLYRESGMSVSCFASSARYEIASNGRKLVGSAQRLFGDTLLQHGSLLLGSGHEQLAAVSNTPSEEHKKVLLNYILRHSVTVAEVCGRKVSYDECAASMVNRIESLS